ncbi:MAG: hypothetical protein JWP52_613 [Rhizobacter sp.]|nr:hypothetical protein [Rhizobacter sp.]
MQYQTKPRDKASAERPASLLMSSAWQRVLGALALIAVLWLAVAWALAELVS